MKKIMSYKLFLESLESDFEQTISHEEGKYNLKYQATLFRNSLPKKDLQQEFMYRVSDGEDIIDLIEEFVDKAEIPNDFDFRALVMDKRISELKSKQEQKSFETFEKIISETEKVGVEKSIEQLKGAIDKGADPESIIVLIEDGITYLIDSQPIMRWAYNRQDWNPNEKKIIIANQLVDFLREYI